MNEPRISIIMASYNSASFIEESIQSVLAQTVTDWELIISDDCSKDDGIKIIKKYCEQDNRISLITSKKNNGPAVTRNKAIDKAKGRYIAFLDSDDLWHVDKLEKQIKTLNETNAALCYGYYDIINEVGQYLRTIQNIPTKTTYKSLLKNQIIGCLTVIYDRNVCDKVKMPVIRKRQDYALWLRILKKGHIAVCEQSVIGTYRLRENSVSSNKWIAIYYTWKMYREVERLPFLKSCYIFGCYIKSRLLKN